MPEGNKKIYLVEDDPAIVDIYKTMMEKAGFNAEVMTLGQDVIKKMKSIQAGEEQKPDLILLDLILPDINGVEVLAEIRSHTSTKDIVVFILSNQEESEFPPGAPKPDKFIVKANISPTQLLEAIKKQLQ